jgi:hypothetical protein
MLSSINPLSAPATGGTFRDKSGEWQNDRDWDKIEVEGRTIRRFRDKKDEEHPIFNHVLADIGVADAGEGKGLGVFAASKINNKEIICLFTGVWALDNDVDKLKDNGGLDDGGRGYNCVNSYSADGGFVLPNEDLDGILESQETQLISTKGFLAASRQETIQNITVLPRFSGMDGNTSVEKEEPKQQQQRRQATNPVEIENGELKDKLGISRVDLTSARRLWKEKQKRGNPVLTFPEWVKGWYKKQLESRGAREPNQSNVRSNQQKDDDNIIRALGKDPSFKSDEITALRGDISEARQPRKYGKYLLEGGKKPFAQYFIEVYWKKVLQFRRARMEKKRIARGSNSLCNLQYSRDSRMPIPDVGALVNRPDTGREGDANVHVYPAFVNCGGDNYLALVMKAESDIQGGKELLWDYNYQQDKDDLSKFTEDNFLSRAVKEDYDAARELGTAAKREIINKKGRFLVNALGPKVRFVPVRVNSSDADYEVVVLETSREELSKNLWRRAMEADADFSLDPDNDECGSDFDELVEESEDGDEEAGADFSSDRDSDECGSDFDELVEESEDGEEEDFEKLLEDEMDFKDLVDSVIEKLNEDGSDNDGTTKVNAAVKLLATPSSVAAINVFEINLSLSLSFAAEQNNPYLSLSLPPLSSPTPSNDKQANPQAVSVSTDVWFDRGAVGEKTLAAATVSSYISKLSMRGLQKTLQSTAKAEQHCNLNDGDIHEEPVYCHAYASMQDSSGFFAQNSDGDAPRRSARVSLEKLYIQMADYVVEKCAAEQKRGLNYVCFGRKPTYGALPCKDPNTISYKLFFYQRV